MSRFNMLSHAIWHCKYHVVGIPKYRYKVLKGAIKEEVENCIHLIIEVPPKVSISEMVGILKGRTAIRVFGRFKQLKQRPYGGNHFWAKGYCVDMIGLDSEMIRRYIEYQENK